MDLVLTKYACPIRGNVPYPEGSLKEAILNALMHNDYSQRMPVTIAFDTVQVTISDSGSVPVGQTVESIKTTGMSFPTNPTLAQVLHTAGYNAMKGVGFDLIGDGYTEYPGLEPVFGIRPHSFVAVLKSRTPFELEIRPLPIRECIDPTRDILRKADCPEGIASRDLVFGLNETVDTITKKYLTPLRKEGLLEFTIPDKPTSNQQRYRTTDKGRQSLSR